jgi:translation initiation factor IF-3
MLGIIPTTDALRLSSESGLDLVEVSPNDHPPVCRIMDFGKFKYEQKKRLTQKNTKQHQIQVKEIRLRPKTGDHDIQFKVKRAKKFLEQKDKVKVNVIFRGRENAHHERGREILLNVKAMLEEVAKIEKEPGMEGPRAMTMILAPR